MDVAGCHEGPLEARAPSGIAARRGVGKRGGASSFATARHGDTGSGKPDLVVEFRRVAPCVARGFVVVDPELSMPLVEDFGDLLHRCRGRSLVAIEARD